MKKGNSNQDESTHTIDNLCKKDKNKIIELLKRLNELKKRCAFLESNINHQNMENQSIETKNDIITKQIDEINQKFNEESSLTSGFPKQLEDLQLAIQATETENLNLKAKIKDSTSEVSELTEVLKQLDSKYNRIKVDASVSCKFSKHREKCINTDDVTANYADAEVQNPERKTEADFYYEDLTSNTFGPVGTLFDAPDDEINSLISILNSV